MALPYRFFAERSCLIVSGHPCTISDFRHAGSPARKRAPSARVADRWPCYIASLRRDPVSLFLDILVQSVTFVMLAVPRASVPRLPGSLTDGIALRRRASARGRCAGDGLPRSVHRQSSHNQIGRGELTRTAT
jgi:hypothetical protein